MNLYLSRLILNAEHPRTRSELERPYEMHRTLSKAWDDLRAARVLFRPERETRRIATVLVQSHARPDLSRLDALNGYLVRADGPMPIDLAGLREGHRLCFRLRCCPSKRVWRPESADHGKRHMLKSREEVFLWLDRKAKAGGFRVEQASFDRVYWRQTKNGQDIALVGVVFDGIVSVEDPNAARDAIVSGIGPAKAFGFGLLSVAPL